jgi:hypothetical protein
MARPRAADDFAAIRARMEELRRERNPAPPSEEELRRTGRLPGSLIGEGRPAESERGREGGRGDWWRSYRGGRGGPGGVRRPLAAGARIART